jgi:DNA-binding NarL/FixJ family response regulator
MATIVIADDHPLFRDALQQTLSSALRSRFPALGTCEAGSIDEVLAYAANGDEVELVLLDLRMPGMEGLGGLIQLRRRFPGLPVVVVSATEDRATVQAAIAYGAAGYIPKSFDRDEIGQAIAMVLDGETFVPTLPGPAGEQGDEPRSAEIARRIRSLTPQQLRVLKLIGHGKPNKIIAYELDIGETTVKAHVTAILRKLKVSSRTQAILLTQRHLDG